MANSKKVLVWKGQDPAQEKASPLHSRLITPEDNGTSREYLFPPVNGHAAEVDEGDVAVIMSGPEKDYFRIQA